MAQLRVEICCTSCGDKRFRREMFTSLSLPLNETETSSFASTLVPKSLDELLRRYFQSRELEYKCERCGNNAVTVVPRFSGLPGVLVRSHIRWAGGVAAHVLVRIWLCTHDGVQGSGCCPRCVCDCCDAGFASETFRCERRHPAV